MFFGGNGWRWSLMGGGGDMGVGGWGLGLLGAEMDGDGDVSYKG